MARELFDTLPALKYQYECVGVSAVVSTTENGETIPLRKTIAFRKIISNMRVIGNDQLNIYFDANGICEFKIDFVEYEQIGEMDLVPFDEAAKRVKTPDVFVLYDDNDTITGAAKRLKVEKVKMLLINQSGEGCTILQPIYNFIGTAENEIGSAEFHSRIIAIPDKYTYDASYTEG